MLGLCGPVLWSGSVVRFCGRLRLRFVPQVRASGSCLKAHDSTRSASETMTQRVVPQAKDRARNALCATIKKPPIGRLFLATFNFTFLYIVEHATSHPVRLSGIPDEKIAAALAPLEATTAVVATKVFPSARMSWSPFAVPSCFCTMALASHAVESSPATAAISATSSGGHGLVPFFQAQTCCF